MTPPATHVLPDGEVQIFEPADQDRGRMYVLDVFGASLLIRQRPNGSLYVHVDRDGNSPAPLGSGGPFAVEVSNGGEVEYR